MAMAKLISDRPLTPKRLSLLLGLVVLAVMGTVILTDRSRLQRTCGVGEDLPPVIEFTWTPLGPLDLKDFRGFLKMRDDCALDFATYRFRIAELDKTLDLPIDGMIGREYESPVALGLLADNPKLADKDRLTIEISVADDKGQETKIERTVRLKPQSVSATLKMDVE